MTPRVPNQLSSARRHALNYCPRDSCWWTSHKSATLQLKFICRLWNYVRIGNYLGGRHCIDRIEIASWGNRACVCSEARQPDGQRREAAIPIRRPAARKSSRLRRFAGVGRAEGELGKRTTRKFSHSQRLENEQSAEIIRRGIGFSKPEAARSKRRVARQQTCSDQVAAGRSQGRNQRRVFRRPLNAPAPSRWRPSSSWRRRTASAYCRGRTIHSRPRRSRSPCHA
jgi:hypothetical protein